MQRVSVDRWPACAGSATAATSGGAAAAASSEPALPTPCLPPQVKAYLRYELAGTWGVVASSNCNVVYDRGGRYLLTGALENVAVWNVKQAALVRWPNLWGMGTKL